MNNEELVKQVLEQRILIDKIYISVEKTRKYFLWTMIATIVAFVLPLIVAIIILPMIMNSYTSLLSGTGLGL